MNTTEIKASHNHFPMKYLNGREGSRIKLSDRFILFGVTWRVLKIMSHRRGCMWAFRGFVHTYTTKNPLLLSPFPYSLTYHHSIYTIQTKLSKYCQLIKLHWSLPVFPFLEDLHWVQPVRLLYWGYSVLLWVKHHRRR